MYICIIFLKHVTTFFAPYVCSYFGRIWALECTLPYPSKYICFTITKILIKSKFITNQGISKNLLDIHHFNIMLNTG